MWNDACEIAGKKGQGSELFFIQCFLEAPKKLDWSRILVEFLKARPIAQNMEIKKPELWRKWSNNQLTTNLRKMSSKKLVVALRFDRNKSVTNNDGFINKQLSPAKHQLFMAWLVKQNSSKCWSFPVAESTFLPLLRPEKSCQSFNQINLRTDLSWLLKQINSMSEWKQSFDWGTERNSK